jgi:hypothetical protein
LRKPLQRAEKPASGQTEDRKAFDSMTFLICHFSSPVWVFIWDTTSSFLYRGRVTVLAFGAAELSRRLSTQLSARKKVPLVTTVCGELSTKMTMVIDKVVTNFIVKNESTVHSWVGLRTLLHSSHHHDSKRTFT